MMARKEEKVPRWIRESVHIRRQGRDALNRDEGQYPLSHTWDHALKHTGKLCVTGHAECPNGVRDIARGSVPVSARTAGSKALPENHEVHPTL